MLRFFLKFIRQGKNALIFSSYRAEKKDGENELILHAKKKREKSHEGRLNYKDFFLEIHTN